MCDTCVTTPLGGPDSMEHGIKCIERRRRRVGMPFMQKACEPVRRSARAGPGSRSSGVQDVAGQFSRIIAERLRGSRQEKTT